MFRIRTAHIILFDCKPFSNTVITGTLFTFMKPIAIDMTICLSNRTAVYSIANELRNLLPSGSPARYWRFYLRSKPGFLESKKMDAVAKVIHKVSSRDFDHLRAIPWPRANGKRMLFVDPIFCSATPIREDDLVLIHDLGPITHADLYHRGAGESYDDAYRKIQKRQPRLVFVSDYTRREFLRLYPAQYPSCDVIPLYFRSMFKTDNCNPIGRQKIVLMVGNVERRKNHVRAIQGFCRSGLPEQGYKLKITGPADNCLDDVLKLIEGNPSIEYLGFVDSSKLTDLYRSAQALLFPSLLEGFGMPALEAPRMGALPIVSRGTVLEEIAGPDALQVDPYSVDSIASALSALSELTESERAAKISAVARFQEKFTIERFREAWKETIAASIECAT